MENNNNKDENKKSARNYTHLEILLVFGIILILFAFIIPFSHWAFPTVNADKYQSSREGISGHYKELVNSIDRKYTCTIDSIMVANNSQLTVAQKKAMTDSIASEKSLIDIALFKSQLSIDSILEATDADMAANLQQQIEHVETINGWWVSIVAGVATLIALCLAIQQNTGYQDQKERINDALRKLEEEKQKLELWAKKLKFMKSIQLLQTAFALFTYNMQTDDRKDILLQMKVLLAEASNRFNEFHAECDCANKDEIVKRFRIPSVMLMQQLERMCTHLQPRLNLPKSNKYVSQGVTAMRSLRHEINDKFVEADKVEEALTKIKSVMFHLPVVIEAEINIIDKNKNEGVKQA